VYDKSARIYDLLYVGSGIKDYPAEAAELHRIIQEACPTAKTLLDVACGTGAHLVEMQRWYTVEGVDLSPAMLAVARTRLPGVPLREADMRTLDLGKTFDAVTCLFSSIGYMHDPGELRAAVARLAAHVAPGGVLILDGWVRPDQLPPEQWPAFQSQLIENFLVSRRATVSLQSVRVAISALRANLLPWLQARHRFVWM